MKKVLFLLVFLMTIVMGTKADSYFDTSSMSTQDQNAPIGWGASVTGSADKNVVTVTTLSELQSALSGTDQKTIIVSGTITFTGRVVIEGVQNKSIYGMPGAILQNPTHTATPDNTGILTLKNCSNIIIRNLTFKGAGAYDVDGNDNLTLQACSNIWIDHCDFQDGVDGNLDCNNGSDNICVSWCRFRYLIEPWSGGSGGSNDHRFSDLWGGGDSASGDEGKLNTTFVNCWWDEGCKQRMPRIRFGKVHILNCLYSSTSADYCVGGGYKSNVYIEKCAFTSTQAQNNPWMNFATSGSYTDYNYTLTGCTGAADAQARSGSIDYFVPSYDYNSYASDQVESVVSNAENGAGATLKINGNTEPMQATTVYSWEGGVQNGGTAVAQNAADATDSNLASDINSSYIRLRGKNDYSTACIVVTFDKKLHAGDKINVTAYRNKNETGKTSGFKAKFDKGGEVASSTGMEFVNINSAVEGTEEYGTEANTCTFTVPDAAEGSTTMTMTRSHTSTNLFITKLEITSTASDAEDPGTGGGEDPVTNTWRNFSAIVNNQTGTLLTAEEQVQGTAVNFGIAVAENGTVSRVAADDASSVATISGTYHSDHGLTGMKVVTAVPGKVTIQIGTCTYSGNKITVTNSNNETVLEYTPQGEQGSGDLVCWKNDHNNIIELNYTGDATTLTITGMGYCPFIAVKEYVEPVEFRDFSAIVNNQTGTLLTSEELVQGTAVSFGVAVAENGTVSRVATGDASSVATISGTYHSDHGLTGMKVVTAVPGKVTIQIGTCTYSGNKITVTNSNNETVLEYTPQGEQGSGDLVCWKNDHNNIIELNYKGDATTLTITGMGYCPFVAVKKVDTAVEKSIYSTDFSDWSTFSASTSEATVVNKTTNFSEETLNFSVYNTALMSVTDTKFANYTTLPHNALQAAKAADPYVTTSKLASITKVRYIHGATGSSRGWKLEAKGDGDADWVTISDSYANPSSWCEVTKDVNRTNCQLRFTNLNSSQNAYMFELEIFGKVELALYEITGTIAGGNIDGSEITLTGNGESYSATVTDGTFTMSVPAGTYTPSLADDVPFLLKSPSSIEVTEAGSIGVITIEEATAQTVTGDIANAPAEAFTLTFTASGNASNTATMNCEAGATSFTKDLMPDTYVISSSVGTLSPLSVENFKVVKDAVTHNIYFPEAAVPAATQQNIMVDNTLASVSANNYKTVTDALYAAKEGDISKPIITLTSGQTYREQVIVDQSDVTLKTSGTEKATITFYYGIGYAYYSLNASGYYDKDRAMTRNSIKMIDPARWGCTVKVTKNGYNFKAENIIFENSFNQYYTEEEVTDGVTPNGVQSIKYDRKLTSGQMGYKDADAKDVTERAAAIAIENNPTGVQFYNCVFRGSQDTFYSSGKVYVKNCNIIGNTDYIFGGGYVVFDDCDLTIGGYSDKETSAYITAYKDGSSLDASKRYVFRDCTVKATDRAYVSANLGRDWGGAAASVYFFNLKNEIGDKLSYKWTDMGGGGISSGSADLHIYDFNPTVNANYGTTAGSDKANINFVLTSEQATTAYTEAVSKLGFTPEHIYDIPLDETSYYNAIRIKASNGGTGVVTLTRSIAADNWSTIVLPFAVSNVETTFGAGTKVARLTSVNENKLTFENVTSMNANEPYMIKVATDFNEASIAGAEIEEGTPSKTEGTVTFQGVYEAGNIPAGAFFVSGNKLYKASDATNTIKPFRAYFTTTNGASELVLDFGGVTAITNMNFLNDTNKGEAYNLAGQRVAQPTKGLYIVNGKKVIIK